MNDLIFISIAAYRDLQLAPTIADCIAKAGDPERLRFGVCRQHGPGEGPLPYRNDARFRILEVDWRQSRGACWARAETMKLWSGEDWFLQVDSHCRFARGWDHKLFDAVERTGSAKPILSTYATPFVPGANEVLQGGPLLMALQGFTPEGIPHMKPMAIPNWQQLRAPLRARFLSAGFLFTLGSFVDEVGYDPELYFLGEEAAMTVRAFTHGYDLFHPAETIVWHDYVRADATKHWDDHTGTGEAQVDWGELDLRSRRKIRRLLTGESVGRYGLGAVRTVPQYEAYAGLSFSLRKAQDYTMRAEEPPGPETAPDWADRVYSWMVRIVIERASLPPESLADPLFWYVGVHDENRNEIYRRDLSAAELEAISGGGPRLALVCELQSGSIPAAWSIWPVSRSRGWLPKIEGRLAEEDFAVVVEEEQEVGN